MDFVEAHVERLTKPGKVMQTATSKDVDADNKKQAFTQWHHEPAPTDNSGKHKDDQTRRHHPQLHVRQQQGRNWVHSILCFGARGDPYDHDEKPLTNSADISHHPACTFEHPCTSQPAQRANVPVHSDGPSALETRLASFFGVEAATAHGVGFTNSLVISVLAGPGSLVLIDQAVQGPLSYSARVNGGTVRHFSHNDSEHLRQLLREAIAHGQPGSGRPWTKVWVVLEGLYDNRGGDGGEYDRCCLSDVVRVCKRYNAYVLLEETRSLAARGRGTCAVEGVDPSGVTLVTCTFPDSFGGAGGCLAGSGEVVDRLRRSNPAHLYRGPMDPEQQQRVLAALDAAAAAAGPKAPAPVGADVEQSGGSSSGSEMDRE